MALITCQLCGAVTSSDLLKRVELSCEGCGNVLRVKQNQCPECELLRKEVASVTRWIVNRTHHGLEQLEEIRRLKKELAQARGATKKACKRKAAVGVSTE